MADDTSRDNSRSGTPPAGGAQVPLEARDAALTEVVGALDMPALVLDNRAVVRGANARARHLFPRLEIGQPIALFLRQPALLSAVDACRDGGRAQTVDLQMAVPNTAWFRVTVSPLGSGNHPGASAPSRMLAVFLDMTEAKRIDTMRADFIANVSHELRTPLTSLTGFIETLQGPAANDAEARGRFLGIMRSQAERMAHLISDLLSLSRIEQRQHMPPTGSVDLIAVLRQVAEGMTPQAKEAGVTINLDLADGPARVTGEQDELYEVFENLVDNAINYGGSGGAVDIGLRPVNNRPGYGFLVEIADHGEGIPPEHVPRLTERFYRVNPESSRQKKGTGLGLAIVKHILSRHRGLLTIRSEIGAGTRAEVLLPK